MLSLSTGAFRVARARPAGLGVHRRASLSLPPRQASPSPWSAQSPPRSPDSAPIPASLPPRVCQLHTRPQSPGAVQNAPRKDLGLAPRPGCCLQREQEGAAPAAPGARSAPVGACLVGLLLLCRDGLSFNKTFCWAPSRCRLCFCSDPAVLAGALDAWVPPLALLPVCSASLGKLHGSLPVLLRRALHSTAQPLPRTRWPGSRRSPAPKALVTHRCPAFHTQGPAWRPEGSAGHRKGPVPAALPGASALRGMARSRGLPLPWVQESPPEHDSGHLGAARSPGPRCGCNVSNCSRAALGPGSAWSCQELQPQLEILPQTHWCEARSVQGVLLSHVGPKPPLPGVAGWVSSVGSWSRRPSSPLRFQ